MKYPIGFMPCDEPHKEGAIPSIQQAVPPVKSLVQVYFPARNQSFSYFNDRFDLRKGHFVFVEGKLENIRGIVLEVNKSFKIKVSDYKKVVGLADTHVSGQLHMAGSHFISFDPSALPYEKIRTWYLPPVKEEDFYETGNDATVYSINHLDDLTDSSSIWDRGHEYYMENRVRYICLENGHGKAIVENTQAYEVEFDFSNGEIRNLLCNCPCGYHCKHEIAAMMQLKEVLVRIEKHYAHLHQDHFAAILKGDLFRFAIDSQETGHFTL